MHPVLVAPRCSACLHMHPSPNTLRALSGPAGPLLPSSPLLHPHSLTHSATALTHTHSATALTLPAVELRAHRCVAAGYQCFGMGLSLSAALACGPVSDVLCYFGGGVSEGLLSGMQGFLSLGLG